MDKKKPRDEHIQQITHLRICERTFYIQATVGQFWQAGRLMMVQCGPNMS
jgi:hypothetical protein